MKKLLLYLLISLFFFHCSSNENVKGELMPPQALFNKGQNPLKTISFITQILESQDGSNLYYLRSKAYFQLHDYKNALVDINNAIEKLPNDIDYLLLSAQIKYNLELYQEAKLDANIVESFGIESPDMLILCTEIHIKLRKITAAKFYLSKLKKLGIPKSDIPYINYVDETLSKDSLHVDLTKYLNFNSVNSDPKLMRNYFDKELYRSFKLTYQNLLLKSLKVYPYDPHLIRSWARFLNFVGQKKMAEKVYLKSNELFINNAGLHFEIGQFYYQTKNIEESIRFLNLINAQSIYFNEALFLKSICFLNLGDRIKSITLLDSGIKFFPKEYKFLGLKNRLLHVNTDTLFLQNDSLKTP